MTSEHLPPPQTVKALFPLSSSDREFIESSRQRAREILAGKDARKAFIMGPCSIHDIESALEYGKRLKQLTPHVEEHCFLVMRVYIEKPRSITGWKGFVYDPFLDESYDIHAGLIAARDLLTELTRMHVPIATEFVDPLTGIYFEDLITWGFIGARTSPSPIHRQFASSLKYPIGFKNTTDGNIEEAIHGIIAAQAPHVFINSNEAGVLSKVHSQGNSLSHLVLRGSEHSANADSASVLSAIQLLRKNHLSSRLMIDCSHGNSQRDYEKQPQVFEQVLEQIEEGNSLIFGLMLESHLHQGKQLLRDPCSLKYAVSITDACIDWETTQTLIDRATRHLARFE